MSYRGPHADFFLTAINWLTLWIWLNKRKSVYADMQRSPGVMFHVGREFPWKSTWLQLPWQTLHHVLMECIFRPTFEASGTNKQTVTSVKNMPIIRWTLVSFSRPNSVCSHVLLTAGSELIPTFHCHLSAGSRVQRGALTIQTPVSVSVDRDSQRKSCERLCARSGKAGPYRATTVEERIDRCWFL